VFNKAIAERKQESFTISSPPEPADAHTALQPPARTKNLC